LSLTGQDNCRRPVEAVAARGRFNQRLKIGKEDGILLDLRHDPMMALLAGKLAARRKG
jgi:hypothetical protein